MKDRIKFYDYNKSNFFLPNSDGVSPHVGFLVIIIFGLIVSWVTVRIGEQIIKEMPSAQINSYNQNIQREIKGTK